MFMDDSRQIGIQFKWNSLLTSTKRMRSSIVKYVYLVCHLHLYYSRDIVSLVLSESSRETLYCRPRCSR